jgi:hypothetical protein
MNKGGDFSNVYKMFHFVESFTGEAAIFGGALRGRGDTV